MPQDVLKGYFSTLAEHYGPAAGDATEHSGRTALENLLNALKPANVSVTHEPGRQGEKGAPDFKIMHGGKCLNPLFMDEGRMREAEKIMKNKEY